MAKRRGIEVWRSLVSGQARSGLGVAAYCARESITLSSFRRWRRVLDAGSSGTRLAAAPVVRARKEAAVPIFVDLGALPERGSPVALRLELGRGVVLQLTVG
jgi:putative transposase